MKIVKMQWEREDAKFIGVSDVVLFVSPARRNRSENERSGALTRWQQSCAWPSGSRGMDRCQ